MVAMTKQEGTCAATSHGPAEAADRAIVSPCPGLKRSPTLLFHILAESDKDKQQHKLRAATLPRPPPPPLTRAEAGGTGTGAAAAAPPVLSRSQPPSPNPRQQLVQQQPQPQPQAAGTSSHPQPAAASAPVAPDQRHHHHHHHHHHRQPQQQPQSRGGARGERTPGPAAPDRAAPQPQPQPQRGGGPEGEGRDAGPAAGPDGGPLGPAASVSAAGGARRPQLTRAEGEAEGEGALGGGGEDGGGEAGAGGAPGAAAAAPPAPPADTDPGPPQDLLADFIPRAILQELLGELFIPPERLQPQGAFGQGAFATVEKCGLEVVPGGPSLLVAVKSLRPQVLGDLGDLRRFLLEANLIRKLNHPNVVSIHGLGAHDLSSLESIRRSAYVVMEGLEGGDLRMMVLRQMTRHSPAYSRLDALRWCTHVAAAAAYLHETCRPMVIHRDLKPENVMLTGGPVDGRVAKITDFGLHKRARYSRTEDVLRAVTHEWSGRGGCAGGGSSSTHLRAAGHSRHSRHGRYGGGTEASGVPVRGVDGGGGGSVRPDASTYGGSVIDASYYGGGAFYAEASTHWNASVSAAAAAAALASSSNGNHLHGKLATGNGGSHGYNHPLGSSSNNVNATTTSANCSTSARYVALAAAGMAAAAAEPALAAAAPDGDDSCTGNHFAQGAGGGSTGSCADGLTEASGGAEAGWLAAARVSTGRPPGGAGEAGGGLRAGSDTAEPGTSRADGTPITERERPYLLAYDKRYDTPPAGGSKWSSATDLVGMDDAPAPAVASAALTAAAMELDLTGPADAADGASGRGRRAVGGGGREDPLQPVGWAAPHVMPPATATATATAAEGSCHRKMLALMALEAAAATVGGGGDANPATAASDGVGGGGTAPHLGEGAGARTGVAMGVGTAPGAATAARTAARVAAAAMKAVPENNRMSSDVGAPAAAAASTAVCAAASGSRSRNGRCSAPGPASAPATAAPAEVRPTNAAARRERGGLSAAAAAEAAAAAARMADATRQVGSLIYMAPELVTSSSYNEKVDVFSFAIIAYELFNGKLLAVKIANEYASQLEAGGSGRVAAAQGARAGPGGLPVGCTRSAEDAAEAGVMSYVLRRCSGAREPLPAWWPGPLRDLIAACWATDPADRPSFSQIHRQLRRLQQSGALADMDERDPLRGAAGCGCAIA